MSHWLFDDMEKIGERLKKPPPWARRSEKEIVSEMCDLLRLETIGHGRELLEEATAEACLNLIRDQACKVLASALYSAKSTLTAGSPRRVFIQDLAAALNRRGLLRDRDFDVFCKLGYEYMRS